MESYVICCNDSVECVVLDTEKVAQAKLERMREEYYALTLHIWPDKKTYRQECFWHIHTVPFIGGC